jgi:hypothetical protein
MPVPATKGQLRTRIEYMQIGDYIICEYQANSGVVGEFRNLGTSTAPEIPVTGAAAPNGSFYLVMVDKKPGHGGILIADRVIQHSILWTTLNNEKMIQGKPLDGYFNTPNPNVLPIGISVIVRSLTGGVAYADENGNLTYVQPNPSRGGFPLSNEWDRYVMNFPPYLIQDGMSADDVFHYSVVGTLVQDTTAGTQWRNMGGATLPITSSYRVYRGYTGRTDNNWKDVSFVTQADAVYWVGFRPVFEYKEG